MKILGIESASSVASAAILDNGIVTAEFTTNLKKTHSETLLPMIEAVIRAAGGEENTPDAIAVSEGPGSFTGLRIGAATAKGLAFAKNIPIIPVPTLDAMAYGCFGSAYVLCPMMDARRGQAYTGLYEFIGGELKVLDPARAIEVEAQVAKAEELAEVSGKTVMYLGCGLPVFREKIASSATKPFVFAPAGMQAERAANIAAYGQLLFDRDVISDAMNFVPLYLRQSQAEEEARKDYNKLC